MSSKSLRRTHGLVTNDVSSDSMIVDLTKDTQIHVFCKPQGSCQVTLVDQEGKWDSGCRRDTFTGWDDHCS